MFSVVSTLVPKFMFAFVEIFLHTVCGTLELNFQITELWC
jgi:hypothetical protein